MQELTSIDSVALICSVISPEKGFSRIFSWKGEEEMLKSQAVFAGDDFFLCREEG